MTASQVAINAKANAWLADLLERWGLTDTTDRAEFVTRELLAQGLAPVPRPFPLRPSTPAASDEARAAAMAAASQAVKDAKARGGRP